MNKESQWWIISNLRDWLLFDWIELPVLDRQFNYDIYDFVKSFILIKTFICLF